MNKSLQYKFKITFNDGSSTCYPDIIEFSIYQGFLLLKSDKEKGVYLRCDNILGFSYEGILS